MAVLARSVQDFFDVPRHLQVCLDDADRQYGRIAPPMYRDEGQYDQPASDQQGAVNGTFIAPLFLHGNETAARVVERSLSADLHDNALIAVIDTVGHLHVELVKISVRRHEASEANPGRLATDRDRVRRNDVRNTVGQLTSGNRGIRRAEACAVEHDGFTWLRWSGQIGRGREQALLA